MKTRNQSASAQHNHQCVRWQRSIVRLFAGLWLLTLWAPSSPAADEITFQPLGSYSISNPGFIFDLQLVGNQAYVALAGGIQVLEVSDPADIQFQGGYSTGDSVLSVQVVGNVAYLANREYGLKILDVTDATNIQLLGSFPTMDYAVDVQVIDGLAYLVDDDNGLFVLDVRNLPYIRREGSYYPGIDSGAVQVVGNRAYLATDSGLWVLDVGNPADIRELGTFAIGNARDVQVVRNLAYVAGGTNGLQVLDVSDPANIQHLGSYSASVSFTDVLVQGHLAFVVDVYAEESMHVLDVSDPANIVRLGGYTNVSWGVQVVGNQVYLASSGALQILQMSGLPVSRPRVALDPENQFAHLGGSATFQVVAAGDEPLHYQWLRNGQPLLDDDRITGATTPQLTIHGLELADRILYSVVISNAYGSVTSAVASLILNLASADAGFDPGANDQVFTMALQSDGKIVVGGSFTAVGGQSRNRLARLNADGTLDPEFDPGVEGGTYPSVQTLAIQPDGKIVVGGNFMTLGGQPRLDLARLNADGTLDLGFGPGAQGANMDYDGVCSLALQADGKILVGGVFTNLAGQARQNIGRLNPDGTLDQNFDPSANNGIDAIALQPDGKILVGGGFTTLGGQPRNFLGRLNADGTLDSGFNPEVEDWVSSLAVQSNGKILVGISQTSAPDLNIDRLNADGTLDLSFQRTPVGDPGGDGRVHTLALQTDGKILAGGEFVMSDEQPRYNLGRLNADGTLDPDFNPGVDYALSLALQPDGKILVGGGFTMLAGQSRTNLARLNNTAPATQSLTYDGATVTWLRGGTSPEVWRTTLDYSTDASNWTSLGAGTRTPGGWEWTSVTVPTNALLRNRGFVAGSGHSEWIVESRLGTFSQTPPVILTNDGNLGVSLNQFGFNLSGVDGQVVVIEGSSNLVHWTSLETNTLSGGLFYFSDPAWSVQPLRFYRARLWP